MKRRRIASARFTWDYLGDAMSLCRLAAGSRGGAIREEVEMPYCPGCGNELNADARFCAGCGRPVPPAPATPATAAAPEQPPMAVGAPVPPAPSYVPPPPTPGAYPPPPPLGGRRRSLKWVWIGGGAAVVIIAIVCVLVLVVFAGDDKGAIAASTTAPGDVTATTQPATGTSALTSTTLPASTTEAPDDSSDDVKNVEKVVRQVFKALEDHDGEALLNLMDPTILASLPDEGKDAVLDGLETEMESMGEMEFSGLEMEVQMTSAATAVVTLTAGKVKLTDATGTSIEDVKEADGPVTLELAKQDGKWYVTTPPFL